MEIIVCNIFLPWIRWKDIDMVKKIETREKCNRQDFNVLIVEIFRINIKSHNFHAVW